jgi:hypothetical protein
MLFCVVVLLVGMVGIPGWFEIDYSISWDEMNMI